MKKLAIMTLLSSIIMCGLAPNIVSASMIKPKITILATGGTIAGSSDSKIDTTDYKPGAITIESLIEAVPELANVATVKGEQTANIMSSDVNSALLLKLAKRVNALFDKESQEGIVVTHGTDTLEETAFFLDLTVKSEHPIVVVGAMRPATAVSADGPMNLLEAVTLAASQSAKNRGTMIVLNDRIGSAYYISKTNSTTLDTFKAIEPGYLGLFVSGQPKFYYTPAQPVDKVHFDLSKISSLPRVDILYSYQDQDAKLLDAIIKNGAKGIVIAGSGNGSLSSHLEEAVKKLQKKGYPVIIASRTNDGYVSSKDYAISAGFLNPQKARILLQLALASGADLKTIATYFDHQR